MPDILQYVLTGLAIAVVLAITYTVSGRFSQNRVAKNFDDPEEILTAADIYVQYHQEKAAVRILQGGLERFPDNAALRARLEQLNDQQK